ncbi:unnamed protein product [Symbiodinium natans]|uniref:Uncharacterized protein n=1 Tax=Symbiodinium natans TaxID=878477 RepID=A0A812MNI2_9DINO|nr:unnamed protein product [Symbiodinium natans]
MGPKLRCAARLRVLLALWLRPQSAEARLLETQLVEECHAEGGQCLQRASRLSERYEELLAAEAPQEQEVTIILNHWQRPAENLFGQLRAAAAAPEALEVWLCVFGSPMAAEYQAVVDDFRSSGGSKVKLISSEVDFGVYGRFLLASAARTRYVYIVDDDVPFPVSAAGQYLRHIRKLPGVWGHAGHIRRSDPETARWVDRPKKPVAVDYANAAWFLETRWIASAFLREPPLSRLTGEDMHLSYMLRKVLGLQTWVVGWRRDKHPLSRYNLGMTDRTTLTPPIFSFRSFLARAQMARGPAFRHPPSFDTLAFVENVVQARRVLKLVRHCPKAPSRPQTLSLLHAGLPTTEVQAVAAEICAELATPCTFVPFEVCGEVCNEMGFAGVTTLDMRVGQTALAHNDTASLGFLAADTLEAAFSLLQALHVAKLWLPCEETWSTRAVRLAAELHSEREPGGLGIRVIPCEDESTSAVR